MQEAAVHSHRYEAGLRCWTMHGAIVCPTCGGSGIVASPSWRERARKGGIRSYLGSLDQGQLSMKKRGKLGGRPRAITIEQLRERRQAAPDPKATRGLPPDENNTADVVRAIRR